MTCERAVSVEGLEDGGASGAGGRPGDKEETVQGRGDEVGLFVPKQSGARVGRSSAHREAEGVGSCDSAPAALEWERSEFGAGYFWRKSAAAGVEGKGVERGPTSSSQVAGRGRCERLVCGGGSGKRAYDSHASMAPVNKIPDRKRVSPGRWRVASASQGGVAVGSRPLRKAQTEVGSLSSSLYVEKLSRLATGCVGKPTNMVVRNKGLSTVLTALCRTWVGACFSLISWIFSKSSAPTSISIGLPWK
ncbi:hypothetical protein K438DRAFT_1778844 [Mycena galopus ATCC 62051]|nr:hypothetical protein K438DRAFT_1778844 [Mycena galopus ATCC 62051]